MKNKRKSKIIFLIILCVIVSLGLLYYAYIKNNYNNFNIFKLENQLAKNSEESNEEANKYSANMIINQLVKKDGTKLGGNEISISTDSPDIQLSFYDANTNEPILENESGNIVVPEDGIILSVDGIGEENEYNIEINTSNPSEDYIATFDNAVITIESKNSQEMNAYVKSITKTVNGEKVTTNGSEEETAIFMYENEENKIKIKSNDDVEIFYTTATLEGLDEESLNQAQWQSYDKEAGVEVEKNGIIYSKSVYKDGKYSEISEIKVTNIDKILPEITVTVPDEILEESYANVVIEDKESEEYGASGIVAYAITDIEEEPAPEEYTTCEANTKVETQINGITNNGTYFLYAKDKVGNINHKQFDVTNVKVKIVAIILQSPVDDLIGTEYTSLNELVQALESHSLTANDGKVVIQIVNDIKNESTVISDKDIELDLNGYTINSKSGSETIRLESGNLKIVDNKYKIDEYIEDETIKEDLISKYTSKSDDGKISNEKNNGILVKSESTLTLGDDDIFISVTTPIIEANEKGIIIEDGGIFNYYDGVLYGKATHEGKVADTPKLYDPTTKVTENENIYKTNLAMVSGIEALIGKTRYTKIETAIAAANDIKGKPGQPVEIDVATNIVKDESIVVDSSKNIILDLNGFSITNTVEDYVIKNSGTIEVIDSSLEEGHVYDESDNETMGGRIETSTYRVLENLEGANFKLTSGTIRTTHAGYRGYLSTTWSYIIINQGNFEINGGFIKSVCDAVIGLQNSQNGKITANNGKIYIKNGYSIENQQTSADNPQIIVNNININQDIQNKTNGNMEINGGTIDGKISNTTNTSKITINDGTLKNLENRGELYINNGNIRYISNENYMKMTDGNIKNSDYSSDGICTINNGNTEILGGTITATDDALWVRDANSKLNISNATVNGEIYIQGGTININQGTIVNGSSYGIRSSSKQSVEIRNAEINGNTAIYVNAGNLKIYDSKITGNTYGINVNNTNSTIQIGEKDNQATQTTTISGGIYGIYNFNEKEVSIPTINYYDGKIIGKQQAIYGLVNEIEEDFSIVLNNTEAGEEATLEKAEDIVYVGEDTSNTFDDLKSALDNCKEEDKITLLKNIVLDVSKVIQIPENKKITLDLNGKEIRKLNIGDAIVNNGELNIIDSSPENTGFFWGFGTSLITNEQDKKIVVENGKIRLVGICNSTIYMIDNKGNLEIRGGTIETTTGSTTIINNTGSLYITGEPLIQCKANRSNLIENKEQGILNIEGGTFESVESYGGAWVIKNSSTEDVNISGGTMRVSGWYAEVITNNSTGKIKLTGRNTNISRTSEEKEY